MKFKTDNQFLFCEGIQFFNGLYETTDEDKIEILKKYTDSISLVEEKPSKPKKTEE